MPDMSSSFLSAFLFAFPVLQLWSCFPSLVDWTFQVFGQLEYFNQRDELLFGELVIINAKGSEERTDLLFLGTALKIHRILQLPLYGCNKGCFISRHGVGTMLLSNVTEDTLWSRSVPNLSGKFKRGSLRYGEAVELADALGYDIV